MTPLRKRKQQEILVYFKPFWHFIDSMTLKRKRKRQALAYTPTHSLRLGFYDSFKEEKTE